jgi:hypothetical protein
MDTEIAQYALIGLKSQRESITTKIEELESQLRGKRTAVNGVARTNGSTRAKGTMSEAGKRRIAAAQRARWARQRREAKASNRTAPRRKTSTTGVAAGTSR